MHPGLWLDLRQGSQAAQPAGAYAQQGGCPTRPHRRQHLLSCRREQANPLPCHHARIHSPQYGLMSAFPHPPPDCMTAWRVCAFCAESAAQRLPAAPCQSRHNSKQHRQDMGTQHGFAAKTHPHASPLPGLGREGSLWVGFLYPAALQAARAHPARRVGLEEAPCGCFAAPYGLRLVQIAKTSLRHLPGVLSNFVRNFGLR